MSSFRRNPLGAGALKAHGKFRHFQIWLGQNILLLVLEPFIGSKLKSNDWEQ